MKSMRRKNKIFLLIILLLGISIGFAALSTTLKIDGSTIFKKNIWSIYWDEDSIEVTEGSKGNTIPDVTNGIDGSINTKLTWNVNLELPGDFYEFTIDAVNSGTLDAMITDINDEVSPTLPNYIRYSVTYDDGTTPSNKDLFPKKDGSSLTKQKYKVRVEVLDTMTRDDVADIPEGGILYTFNYEVQYGQADDTARPVGNFFAVASWDSIISEYENGDPNNLLHDDMENGIKRKVTLDLDHDGTPETQANLRIANLSRPSECAGSDYSQTACGFVVEFAEVVTTHKMNYYDKSSYAHNVGEGTWGGWQYSDMRAFLNGYTYTIEDVNYSGVAFVDALPSDLKNKIINTKVSTSSNRGGNFSVGYVTDKMYLLSPRELWGNKVAYAEFQNDLNFNKTRQLDYYDIIGAQADGTGYPKVIKEVINHDEQEWPGVPEGWSKDFWALREAYGNRDYDSSFFRVMLDGTVGWTYSVHAHGVSPAFRIAE